MRKQQNSLQYGGNNISTIIIISIIIYISIYSKSLYVLSEYVQHLQSIIIQGKNTESLCTSPYENETLRYSVFMFLHNDKNTLHKLQKTHSIYAIFAIILSCFILCGNLFFKNFNIFSIVAIICIIIESCNLYVINNRLPLLNSIPSINEYIQTLTLLKNTIFTSAHLGQVSTAYTIDEITAYISKAAGENATQTIKTNLGNAATEIEINEAVTAATEPSAVSAAAHACFSPGASIETAVLAVTGGSSANEDLVKAANKYCGLVSLDTINPALLALEKNILRRLLHASRTPDIVTADDALAYYNTLRQTDNGINELIGYVDFAKNSEDYSLLKTAVCGQYLCGTEGIGQDISNLSPESYANLISLIAKFPGLPSIHSPSPHPSPSLHPSPSPQSNKSDLEAYMQYLSSVTTTVATYNVELANKLRLLEYNDPIWKDLRNLTPNNKYTMLTCKCVGDLLELGVQKNTVLIALERLSLVSYDNPETDLLKYINYGNGLADWKGFALVLAIFVGIIKVLETVLGYCGYTNYMFEILTIVSLIVSFIITLSVFKITTWILLINICSIYLLFHFVYTVFGPKEIALIYFGLLLFGAFFIAYTSKI